MKPIGDIFAQHGSDKNTFHSYGLIYDRLFPDRAVDYAPWTRADIRDVLEIGIASGQSVMAWLDIFPNARVLGIDKEPCHNAQVGSTDAAIYPVTPRPDRLEIKQADIRDVPALKAAVGERQFDLIVEDSSHQLDDNLRCAFLLYPNLKPGGLYIIEEMDGAHSHRDSLELFKGVEFYVTTAPVAGELLVVIRKLISNDYYYK